MRVVWIGFHMEGLLALEALIANGTNVVGVLTLKPDFAGRRSGVGNYHELCARHKVPCYEIGHINDSDSIQLLKTLEPDIGFVIGWSQIVGPEALAIPPLGMIGAHASLLPRNRGSAPINWAIINGESETGNSLIWLENKLDHGDVIDQTAFPILPYDTCATLYEKVAVSNRDMILRLMPRLLAGQRPGTPQGADDLPLLPRRRPADGQIDWSWPATKVYDFVRALARPYPGAFSYIDGQCCYIWQAALIPDVVSSCSPGAVVGPVYSPAEAACGQTVACGSGFIIVLEVEINNTILTGRELAVCPWRGKDFSYVT